MDSFALRQEQETLVKNVNTLKHQLEVADARMKELHEEEMRYLAEIPQYKQQARDAQAQAKEAQAKVSPIKQELDELNKELIVIRGLNSIESKSLTELKETQKKIIEETKAINEQIKGRHEQLKQRELAVADKEKACELREVGYSNRDFELTKGEVELAQKQQALGKAHEILSNSQDIHNENVKVHKVKVDALIEQREFLEQDRADLQNKLAQVDKLKKEQIGMKSSLLLQAEKADTAIKAAENKQKILDRALDDLKNQENNLKLKELRVQKLIKDKGLQQELKELEESLK